MELGWGSPLGLGFFLIALGIFFSGHPLDEYAELMARKANLRLSDVETVSRPDSKGERRFTRRTPHRWRWMHDTDQLEGIDAFVEVAFDLR